MSVTLDAGITAQGVNIRTTGDPAHVAPFTARLDDEIVAVSSYSVPNGRARIVRGQYGSVRVPHAAGTTIEVLAWADQLVLVGARYSLFGEGAPSDGTDGTGALVAGPGSTYIDVAAGALYVNGGTAASPSWQAGGGGGSLTVTGATGSPSIAAGIVQVGGPVTEPIAGTAYIQAVVISDTDPGAIGPGNFWLALDPADPTSSAEHFQLYARNLTDDGWLMAGAGDAFLVDSSTGFVTGLAAQDLPNSRLSNIILRAASDGSTDVRMKAQSSSGLSHLGIGPADVQMDVGVNADSAGFALAPGTVSANAAGVAGAFGFFLDPTTFHFGLDASAPGELAGTIDPSAGGGIAAPIASTYRRDNSGTGELWLKTGAADTAWQKITIP